jgi:hypothetical protein
VLADRWDAVTTWGDDAFAELRRRSQHANRKLRDIAVELVEHARHESRP